MRVYQPKIRIRLVKVLRRKELAPGLQAVMKRYQENNGFDLTPFLGDGGSVRVAKGVREPAGSFSLTLCDQMHPQMLETLYALIEPMDMVEIRIAHDPYSYSKPGQGYEVPVLMRGLVSTVHRGERMVAGKPQRTVQIGGQDFGKVLQIIQIFYLNNSVIGDNVLSELAFFQKYSTDAQAKIKPAADFALEVVKNLVAPYLGKMLAAAKAEEVGAQKIDSWGVRATVAGSVSPYAVAAMRDASLYSMLATLLDVGAFNEMFVQDDPQGVTLVVRPTPLRTAAGQWIQKQADGTPAKADFVTISSQDVVSINLGRSDVGVANYFWVDNTRWTLMHNETAKMAADAGPTGDYVLFEYPNSAAAMFGIRKMELGVSLGDPQYSNADGAPSAQLAKDTGLLGRWLHDRRRVLAEINKDNVIFESGTLTVRGNERIKAGMYLRLERGVGNVSSEYYVTRVEHEVVPLQGYTTLLSVERGTSFITRAGTQEPVYLSEMDAGGVQ